MEQKEEKTSKVKKNKLAKYEGKKEKEDGKIKRFFKKIGETINKRVLVKGTTTAIFILIIFAIYIGVTVLLDKVILPEYDFTTDKIYSISDETKTKVGSLEKDVTITVINYANNEVIDLLEKYQVLSDHLKIERIDDLTGRTDIMQEYSLSTSDSLIVVKCGSKEKTINSDDMYTFDYSTYQTVDTKEEAITNAIVDVITDEKPTVYFMSNHVMYADSNFSQVKQEIADDANEIGTVDLLVNGKVPEDCNILVITTLKEDITEVERDYITDYINNGGKLLLLCGPNLTGNELTNFNQILALYGITIEDGIIFEQDTARVLNGYPDILVEDVQANSTTKNMNMNLKACFIDAAAITLMDDSEKLAELGVTYETLLTTSNTAFIRTNLNLNTVSRTSEDSEEKAYIIGAMATKEIDSEKTSKLIIYSNELFASDGTIPIGSYTYIMSTLYNNKDIVANAVSYLNNKENTITIRKNSESVTYSVTQKQHNIIMGIIFIIPFVIILIGIIVWRIRNHKK